MAPRFTQPAAGYAKRSVSLETNFLDLDTFTRV